MNHTNINIQVYYAHTDLEFRNNGKSLTREAIYVLLLKHHVVCVAMWIFDLAIKFATTKKIFHCMYTWVQRALLMNIIKTTENCQKKWTLVLNYFV